METSLSAFEKKFLEQVDFLGETPFSDVEIAGRFPSTNGRNKNTSELIRPRSFYQVCHQPALSKFYLKNFMITTQA